MDYKLWIFPPPDDSDFHYWAVKAGDEELATGLAKKEADARRACMDAFLSYAKDMGWEERPPADVVIILNFFPPGRAASTEIARQVRTPVLGAARPE